MIGYLRGDVVIFSKSVKSPFDGINAYIVKINFWIQQESKRNATVESARQICLNKIRMLRKTEKDFAPHLNPAVKNGHACFRIKRNTVFTIIYGFRFKRFFCRVYMKNCAPVDELNFIDGGFRIRVTAYIIKQQITTIVSVHRQRIAKFHMVNQAEKRIAQREIVAVAEKVNAPTAVQILFDCDLSVARFDVNITAASVQIFDGFGCQVIVFVNAVGLDWIAVKPRLNVREVVGID